MRVLAAMSGGVDSAVAAARLRDAGHEVTGVHLALSAKPATMREGARGCCSVEDSRDARRCADVLDIPFYVWDLATRFPDDVVEPFVAEYAAGRTPEPVPAVQREDQVLGRAGAGPGAGLRRRRHRALRAPRRRPAPPRRRPRQGPVLRPRRAARPTSSRARSSRSATARSREVRAEAARARARRRGEARQPRHLLHPLRRHPRRSSPNASRRRRARWSTPSGAVVGHHARRPRLHRRPAPRPRHLPRPAPDGRPRYVLGLEPVSRTVRVGPAEELDVTELTASDAGVARRAAGRSARVRRSRSAPTAVSSRRRCGSATTASTWCSRSPCAGSRRARPPCSTGRTPTGTSCSAAPRSPRPRADLGDQEHLVHPRGLAEVHEVPLISTEPPSR